MPTFFIVIFMLSGLISSAQDIDQKFKSFNIDSETNYLRNEALISSDITLTNQMVNGSFESWNTDGNIPAGMSTFANGGSFTYEHSNDAKIGTKSFKAVSASTKSTYPLNFTNIARNSGDKIYFGTWIKTSKRISSSYLDDHSGYMTVPAKLNTWEWCSYITTSNSGTGGLQLRINQPDKNSGDYVMLDGVYYINLTQVFGAGAEPDILDLDLFVRNHSYFSASSPQAINNLASLIDTYKKGDPILKARQSRLSDNTLRVGTYNTKSGYTQFNLTRKNIADLDLDLIGLQEVAEPYDKSKSFNNLITNFNLSYTHHFPIARTTYDYGIVGIGIGSAFPLINPTSIPDGYNGCIKTVVKFGGKNVSFYNTHLKVPADNTEAKTFINNLWNEIISSDTSKYIIVTADYNAPVGKADLGIFQSFVNNGFISAQGPEHGWYSTYIGRNDLWIDNVLVKGFKILSTGIKNPSVASDHDAFWAEIQMVTDSKTNQNPPVLNNIPADKYLGYNPELPTCDPKVTASGGCSEATVSCTPGSIKKEGCNRSQTFTYTATDDCGNKATATTTYTWIEDLTPPVLVNVPSGKDLGNNPELPACDAKVTAADECSEALVVCTPGEIKKDGYKRSQAFTYTATDASGNKATATTTYTWTENPAPPVLTNVPANKDLGYNPELPTCNANVTATGGCSNATVKCTPGAITSEGCNRSQTFTYTATDDCGNKVTATTTYTWTEDLTPPVLADVPSGKDLGSNPELPACDPNVTASDQCSEALVVCTPGEIKKDGYKRSQAFTYTATDASGNKATATTTYTWTENPALPVLTNVPANKDLGYNPGLPTCDANVTATGGCSNATVECTPGAITSEGCTRSQTFTYTATDDCGNKVTATTTYTWIEDLTPPVLANVPSDKDLGSNPERPACDPNVTASDQCSEALVVCTPGEIKKDGYNRIQTFTYTATDVSGNQTTATTTYNWSEAPDKPVADFAATENVLKEGETVQLEDLSGNNPVTWSWKFEGGTPSKSSQKNPSVKYNLPGKYSVTLTVANDGGSDTKSVENFITVEENDFTTDNEQISGQTSLFRFYPNPVSKELVIEVNSALYGSTYTLYNLNGVKLNTDKIISKHTTIDLSERVPGTYIMMIEKDNQIFREIIVKQ